ncbi:MAG TPA: hypothetical protein VFE05_20810 [Longimicrobiaceae bacterium]|jgi:hypothetical protein|nr:hypothetical protein [Longimicrobiaceae bacterium]
MIVRAMPGYRAGYPKLWIGVGGILDGPEEDLSRTNKSLRRGAADATFFFAVRQMDEERDVVLQMPCGNSQGMDTVRQPG